MNLNFRCCCINQVNGGIIYNTSKNGVSMSTKEKKLRKLRNNPKGVSFEVIDSLLTAYGFTSRNRGSSHFIDSHPLLNEIEDYVNIPKHRPVKPIYIKKAIALIDKLLERVK